jgi:hypothetical protein
VLDGGDGNDIVAANFPDLANTLAGGPDNNDATRGSILYPQQAVGGFAYGSISLNGSAGNDVIIGNTFRSLGAADTLTGGDGDDTFYPIAPDTVADLGGGQDTIASGNQFVGNAAVTQTANLRIIAGFYSTNYYPAQGLGENGSKSRIYVSDQQGAITMQGPAGSTFLLGDLLNAAGYPVSQLGIPSYAQLTVNGFTSPLTGNQIAGYRINNGDVIELSLTPPG